MERWVDGEGTLALLSRTELSRTELSRTEMVGIP